MSLLPVDLANGLEFDGAVVVEPAAVVDESPQGLRRLYVALTRPTRRLCCPSRRPLPASLRSRSTVSGTRLTHREPLGDQDRLSAVEAVRRAECSGARGAPSASKGVVSQALSVDPHAPGRERRLSDTAPRGLLFSRSES